MDQKKYIHMIFTKNKNKKPDIVRAQPQPQKRLCALLLPPVKLEK